jgi:hypothetical protein
MEEGQSTPIVAAALVLAMLLVLALGRLGAEVVGRAEAQAAADAAALAGAVGGEPAARATAADNGAVLVIYREAGAQVQVTVRERGREATATAEAVIVPP